MENYLIRSQNYGYISYFLINMYFFEYINIDKEFSVNKSDKIFKHRV